MERKKIETIRHFLQQIDLDQLEGFKKTAIYKNFYIAQILFHDFNYQDKEFNQFVASMADKERVNNKKAETLIDLYAFFGNGNDSMTGLTNSLNSIVNTIFENSSELKRQYKEQFIQDIRELNKHRVELEEEVEKLTIELDAFKKNKTLIEKDIQRLEASKEEYLQLNKEKKYYEELVEFSKKNDVANQIFTLKKESKTKDDQDLLNKLKYLKKLKDWLFTSEDGAITGDQFIDQMAEMIYGNVLINQGTRNEEVMALSKKASEVTTEIHKFFTSFEEEADKKDM